MKFNIVVPMVVLITFLLGPALLVDSMAPDGLEWTVESTGLDGKYTSIALDSSGRPHISYNDTDGVNYAYLMYAYKDAAGWHSLNVDSGGSSIGAYASIVLDGDDYPHICYRGPGNLKYAHQDAAGWHTEDATTESGTEGDYCSIALDEDGYPHISYKDYLVTEPDGHLKYAYKDATGWHIESVTYDGEYTDIALDSNGYPHISCRSFDSGSGYQVTYAYKDNTGWHSTNVESGTSAYTSIALNSGNNPRISYYASGLNDLKFAYKDDAGWHIETVDSAGTTGQYTSLALDSSGDPHISYYDFTNVTFVQPEAKLL